MRRRFDVGWFGEYSIGLLMVVADWILMNWFFPFLYRGSATGIYCGVWPGRRFLNRLNFCFEAVVFFWDLFLWKRKIGMNLYGSFPV